MSTSDPGVTRALADLAFGSSNARITDTSRPLAWLSPEDMQIDLSDPKRRRLGDYELLEQIGQGGMGVVYRARQHGLERDVAFKVLAAGPWASVEFVERFRREARAAARMQHPNIVEVYEFGHHEGLNYFSMRLVEGESLAGKLAREGRLPSKDAAGLLMVLADAVDYAHRLGVLHLDLKPGNVLLTRAGEPLIADFGLARRIDAGLEGPAEIVGTPSYMAPEQALLESHPLSASTDIWGLGAILYELLTGRPPFLGANALRTLQSVIAEEVTAPRAQVAGIPADLEAICLRCLEKDPRNRYVSAGVLAADLRRYTEGRAVSVRPLSAPQRLWRWARREPRLALATAAAFLAMAIGGAIATWQWQAAEAARQFANERAAQSARMAALLARAFPLPKDEAASVLIDASAARVVEWLDRELGAQPGLQEAVLTELIDGLDRADNPGAAQALLYPVVKRLGREYLLAAAEAQIAKDSPRGWLLGAILLEAEDLSAATRARQQQLFARAIEAAPQDLDTLASASYYCGHPDSPCARLQPGRRLAEQSPENAAHWIYAMASEPDEARHADLLVRAAAAREFDDHFRRVMRLNLEAIESAELPLPPLLEVLTQRLTPEAQAVDVVAHLHAWAMPIPSWQHPARLCRPDLPALRDESRRSQCLTIGRRAAFESDSLLASMVGSAIVRHMRPDAAEVERARELRRHYVYVTDARSRRTPAQFRASGEGLLGREMTVLSEIEAYKRTLDRAGIPRDPPADWQPADLTQLMTAREREVYRARQAEVLRQDLVPTPAE